MRNVQLLLRPPLVPFPVEAQLISTTDQLKIIFVTFDLLTIHGTCQVGIQPSCFCPVNEDPWLLVL